jgi:predicted transcriptional regulator
MSTINTDEWRAELDALLASTSYHGPIIVTDGFTMLDLMAQKGMTRTTAQRVVTDLCHAGKVKHIGYRPGKGGPKVYQVVK